VHIADFKGKHEAEYIFEIENYISIFSRDLKWVGGR
jgi:hypothetical protein